MDTGLGNMAEISEDKFDELEEKGAKGIFRVGEEVELNGSKFKISKVTPKKLTLRILS